MLPALGPEPTRCGSIHGSVADHFLHGVAPSAATSTLVGVAAALALARAAALLLLSVPCLVCSCYCSCSRCCSRSCSCLRCCSDLATLRSTEFFISGQSILQPLDTKSRAYGSSSTSTPLSRPNSSPPRPAVRRPENTPHRRFAAAPAIPLGPPCRAFSPAIPTPPPRQRPATAGDHRPRLEP